MAYSRPPEDAELIEQPGRCEAILSSTYHWRCASKEVDRGICRLHGRHGAAVPTSWQHWRNDRGVVCCEPVAPMRQVAPDSLAYFESVRAGDRLTDGEREIVAMGPIKQYTLYMTDSYGRDRPKKRWRLQVETPKDVPLYIDESALCSYELVTK